MLHLCALCLTCEADTTQTENAAHYACTYELLCVHMFKHANTGCDLCSIFFTQYYSQLFMWQYQCIACFVDERKKKPEYLHFQLLRDIF